MFEETRIQRLAKAIEKYPSARNFERYLPTPDHVQLIIEFTNAGRIKEAESYIERMKSVLLLISNDLFSEDREWFTEIIDHLNRSVKSAQD